MPVVLCAFACVSFVHEALTMAETHTPTKVVIHPASATVVSGRDASFTATVYDQNNRKMSGVGLTWSLTTPVSGCTITQNGIFKTTAGTTPLGPNSNLVQATVADDTSVFGQASVSVLQMPFTGGVFIGTRECTSGSSCPGGTTDQSPLAMVAAATTFTVLTIDSSDNSAQQFSGTITDKDGDVGISARFTTPDGHKTTITGQIAFDATGEATRINGTYTSVVTADPAKNNSGTFTLSAVSAPGAGPKIGSWSIPKNEPPTGALYVIFDENGDFVATSASNKGGTLKYLPFSGIWAAGVTDGVTFTMSGKNATGGSGTCNSNATNCSGQLDDNSIEVGTWHLGDL
jgi:hypothetical protein